MFVRVLIVAVIGLMLWSVAAGRSQGAGEPQVYTVRVHETLWSIAAAHYAGDPREGVWKLQRRNHLDGTVVHPGQRLVVPP